MGAESTSGSGESNETQVVLNVYDLTPINNYMYWFGFGIFHSGIEVHGKEYGFGAHDFPVSGVFEVEPRNCPGFLYRNSIQLGKINMPPSEFRSFIEGMASEYHGDTYHLISKNCNHFTDDVSWRLTGRHVPGWVNRLARLGVHGTAASFCLSVKNGVCDLTGRNLVLDCLGAVCSCLLPESLQVTSVKQLSEYPEYSDDNASESISNATPRESTEVYDTDQEKHLLSPPGGSGEVVFVKETKSDSWSSAQELKMPFT